MSVAELARFVGKEGLARLVASHGSSTALQCPVIVKDARASFGRVDLLVTPVGGEGELWMDSAGVTIPSEGAES